jgi:SAM-dependent methyltransferase
MGEEKGRDYYNSVYKKSHKYSINIDANSTYYASIYNFILKLLNKNEHILELGCGTGQFAEKLINLGYNYKLGVDFSDEGIRISKQRCPDAKFMCNNLHEFDFSSDRYTTIIALETMEHILNDKFIINKIPIGTRVILSLPMFNDQAHVRFFKTENDLMNYYKDCLSDMKIYKLGRFFIIDSIK